MAHWKWYDSSLEQSSSTHRCRVHAVGKAHTLISTSKCAPTKTHICSLKYVQRCTHTSILSIFFVSSSFCAFIYPSILLSLLFWIQELPDPPDSEGGHEVNIWWEKRNPLNISLSTYEEHLRSDAGVPSIWKSPLLSIYIHQPSEEELIHLQMLNIQIFIKYFN